MVLLLRSWNSKNRYAAHGRQTFNQHCLFRTSLWLLLSIPGSVETGNKSTPVKSYRLEENSEPLKVLTPASSPEVGGEKTEFPVAEVDSFSAVDHPKVKYLPNGAVEPVGIETLSVALDEPIGIEGFPPELDQPIRSNEAIEEEIITPVSSGNGNFELKIKW